MPKLSHQLLKGQNFGADGATRVEEPTEKENLSPNLDESCPSSIQDHLKMSEFLGKTLQLINYMPESCTHALACPGRNNGLSPPYISCSANHTKSKREVGRFTGKTEHMLFSFSLF